MNIINDWLNKNGDKKIAEKVKLILSCVVSTYYCKSYEFKRQERRCTKQCISCEWMEKKQ